MLAAEQDVTAAEQDETAAGQGVTAAEQDETAAGQGVTAVLGAANEAATVASVLKGSNERSVLLILFAFALESQISSRPL
jgi:hypothetical protein